MELSNKTIFLMVISISILIILSIFTIKDYLKNKNKLIVRGRRKLDHRFWSFLGYILLAVLNFLILTDVYNPLSKAFIYISGLYILLAIIKLIEYIDGDAIYKSYISINGITYKWDEIKSYKSRLVNREVLTKDKKFLAIEFTIKESENMEKVSKKEQCTVSIDIELDFKEKAEDYLDKAVS